MSFLLDRSTPLGEALDKLARLGYLTANEAGLLFSHLVSDGRRADWWDESAARQIVNNVPAREQKSVPANHAYVREKKADMGAGTDTRHAAARRWLGEPLESFERALRSAYADRGAVLSDHHAAYLCSAFVLCLLTTPSRQTLSRTNFLVLVPAS